MRGGEVEQRGHNHFMCLNCQSPMKVDESFLTRERKGNESDYSEQTTNIGHSRNLMQIICDAQTPGEAPICKTCSDALLEGMEVQLNSLDSECFDLKKLIDDLRLNHNNTDISAYNQEIANLKAEEDALKKEMAELGEQDRKDENTLQKLKLEMEKGSEREKNLWKDFRDHHKKLLELDDESRRLDAELLYADLQLRRLTTRNVLDLCFHIWVDGPIAQINGFHLGRLPHQPVEWSEINAAWGQAALLLNVLLQRMNVQMSMYKIMTIGSHSYIKSTKPSGETRDLPLHSSGGWKPFGTGSHNTDDGAVAFLECMATLQSTLKFHDAGWNLPHAIRKDRLLDRGNMEFSVKMQFNSEERWTKAMKCLLTNLKFALTMVDILRQRGPVQQQSE